MYLGKVIRNFKFPKLIGTGNVVFPNFRFNSTNIRSDNNVKVCTIPVLKDNYMYVLIDQLTKIAAVVDPVEPEKAINIVKDEGVKLETILTTHHHWDHAGGNKGFLEKIPDLFVYGGDGRIDCLTNKITHGDKFSVGSLNVECLFTPCHTSGHICYYISGGDINPICFTGDTLFVGGCGRFFEGSAEDMHKALQILSSLPGNTKVYCGHEYTVSNLKFAVHVEPNNKAAKEKLAWAENKRRNNEPTVPSTINDEMSFNPFMRVLHESVKQFAKQSDPASVMKILRDEKNKF